MKHIFILLAIILTYSVTEGKGSKNHSKNNVLVCPASESRIITPDVSGLFNIPTKENTQSFFRQIFPTLRNGFPAKLQANTNVDPGRNKKISNYIIFTRCQIKRLEGTDIIHPFNYFW